MHLQKKQNETLRNRFRIQNRKVEGKVRKAVTAEARTLSKSSNKHIALNHKSWSTTELKKIFADKVLHYELMDDPERVNELVEAAGARKRKIQEVEDEFEFV